MGKQMVGEFEHHVLLALLRQGDEGYSVPIISELEERTGREVAPAAVYIALRRLEAKGLFGIPSSLCPSLRRGQGTALLLHYP